MPDTERPDALSSEALRAMAVRHTPPCITLTGTLLAAEHCGQARPVGNAAVVDQANASLGSRPEEGRVTKEAVMAQSTAMLVRYEDPDAVTERSVVAGFLAGYSGSTRVSYTTDLRLFAAWCAGNGVRLLQVKRAQLELFARHMEAEGLMRSTVARRLSTLASFYRYCHVEGILTRNPAAIVRRPKVDHESRTLGLDRNELGALLI